MDALSLLALLAMALSGLPDSKEETDGETGIAATAKCYERKCTLAGNHATAGLDCWDEKLAFFEPVLGNTLRQIVLTEANRQLWMAHNSTSGRVPLRQGASDYYEALAREAVSRMLHIPDPPLRDPPSNWDRHTKRSLLHGFMPDLYRDVQRLCEALLLRKNGWHDYQHMEDRRPTVSGSISSRSAEDDAHHHQLPAVQVHHYVAGVSRYIQPADSLPELLVQCPRGCEQAWSHWAWALVGSGLVNVALAAIGGLVLLARERHDAKHGAQAVGNIASEGIAR